MNWMYLGPLHIDPLINKSTIDKTFNNFSIHNQIKNLL